MTRQELLLLTQLKRLCGEAPASALAFPDSQLAERWIVRLVGALVRLQQLHRVDASLPPVVPPIWSRPVFGDTERLVRELVHRQWALFCFGRRDAPDAIAATCRSELWADVVVLRGHDRAVAYRALVGPQADPLAVEFVVWHYLSDAEQTLRAVLDVSPDVVRATPYPIPQECRVPERERRPVVMRPGRPVFQWNGVDE
jgi:hypothetical protein